VEVVNIVGLPIVFASPELTSNSLHENFFITFARRIWQSCEAIAGIAANLPGRNEYAAGDDIILQDNV
jgi:hypothetical protein